MKSLQEIAVEMARPDIKKYVVAMQPIADSGHCYEWRELRFRALDEARALYDGGHVELCQKRCRDHHQRIWVLLYAIPRKRPRTDNLNYFGTQGRA